MDVSGPVFMGGRAWFLIPGETIIAPCILSGRTIVRLADGQDYVAQTAELARVLFAGWNNPPKGE